jgi:hypothetical protein
MPLPLKPEVVKVAQAFFSGKEPAFATTLLAILFKTYGVQVLEWDGLTIEMQVKDDFSVEMPSRVYDKLMALITALSNDAIYRDVTFFDEFVSAINGRGLGTEDDAPAVDDVAWAVAELTINDPRPFGREPYWYNNIKIYTRVILDDEGMDIPPQVLAYAGAKTPKNSVNEAPADYAATWGEKQAKADEVDNWISERMVALVQQLMEVGVDLASVRKPSGRQTTTWRSMSTSIRGSLAGLISTSRLRKSLRRIRQRMPKLLNSGAKVSSAQQSVYQVPRLWYG